MNDYRLQYSRWNHSIRSEPVLDGLVSCRICWTTWDWILQTQRTSGLHRKSQNLKPTSSGPFKSKTKVMRCMYPSTGLVLFVLPRHENHHLPRFLGIFSFISLSVVACEGHAHRRNAQQLKNSQNKLSKTKATRIKQMLDSHAENRIDRNYCNELRKERNEAEDKLQHRTHDWALQTNTHTHTHTQTRNGWENLIPALLWVFLHMSNYKCLVFVYKTTFIWSKIQQKQQYYLLIIS